MLLRNDNKKLSLAGMLAALTLVFLFAASFLSNITFFCLALSSVSMYAILLKTDKKYFFIAYAAVGLLSFLLAADKKIPLYFILGFGIYPVINEMLMRFKLRTRYIIKLIYFAVMLGVVFVILKTALFGALQFKLPIVLLGIIGLLVLFVYDYVLNSLTGFIKGLNIL